MNEFEIVDEITKEIPLSRFHKKLSKQLNINISKKTLFKMLRLNHILNKHNVPNNNFNSWFELKPAVTKRNKHLFYLFEFVVTERGQKEIYFLAKRLVEEARGNSKRIKK